MKRLIALVGLATLVAATLVVPSSASEQREHVIFLPRSHPYGTSYREWGADWLEWAFEAPASTSPLINPDNCGPGESQRVWFLSASPGGTATANCTVPAHKAIFFIPGGFICSPAVGDPETSYQGLRRCVLKAMPHVSDARATVDGQRVEHLRQYFHVSRLVHLHLNADNIFGDAPGSYPAVIGAYFVMARPLSVGHHTITLFDELSGAHAALTYHITVVPDQD
jgi:hypothetical protein